MYSPCLSKLKTLLKYLHLFSRLICSSELLKHLFLLHLVQQILISFTVELDVWYS